MGKKEDFNVSLIVRDKVTIRCPQTTTLRDCWLVECCFTSTETVGFLGTGAQDVHLDFYTAPELCERL